MVPKVLVSDKLSQTAIKIFKEKGIEVASQQASGS